MNAFWKWLAVAGCGAGLLVAVDRLRVVRADDDAPAYERSGGGDSLDRLDRIVDKLGRVVDRMEHPGPHGRPPHGRPPRDGERPEHGPMHHGSMHDGRHPHGPHHGPGPMWGEMSPEMKDRMEKARAKFKEMEERIEKLEAEVAELKAGN
jgi:uncharacterized coiled-coil protein SlyX